MDTRTHFTDAFRLQIALRSGLVQTPQPEWDPSHAGWVVRARSPRDGADWVLTRRGRAAAFTSREQARKTADGLRGDGYPYVIGQR